MSSPQPPDSESVGNGDAPPATEAIRTERDPAETAATNVSSVDVASDGTTVKPVEAASVSVSEAPVKEGVESTQTTEQLLLSWNELLSRFDESTPSGAGGISGGPSTANRVVPPPSVIVSPISREFSIAQVKEFFSFCGSIVFAAHVSLPSADGDAERGGAFLQFADPSATSTAVLLSGAQIGGSSIRVRTVSDVDVDWEQHMRAQTSSSGNGDGDRSGGSTTSSSGGSHGNDDHDSALAINLPFTAILERGIHRGEEMSRELLDLASRSEGVQVLKSAVDVVKSTTAQLSDELGVTSTIEMIGTEASRFIDDLQVPEHARQAAEIGERTIAKAVNTVQALSSWLWGAISDSNNDSDDSQREQPS